MTSYASLIPCSSKVESLCSVLYGRSYKKSLKAFRSYFSEWRELRVFQPTYYSEKLLEKEILLHHQGLMMMVGTPHQLYEDLCVFYSLLMVGSQLQGDDEASCSYLRKAKAYQTHAKDPEVTVGSLVLHVVLLCLRQDGSGGEVLCLELLDSLQEATTSPQTRDMARLREISYLVCYAYASMKGKDPSTSKVILQRIMQNKISDLSTSIECQCRVTEEELRWEALSCSQLALDQGGLMWESVLLHMLMIEDEISRFRTTNETFLLLRIFPLLVRLDMCSFLGVSRGMKQATDVGISALRGQLFLTFGQPVEARREFLDFVIKWRSSRRNHKITFLGTILANLCQRTLALDSYPPPSLAIVSL